MEQKIKKNIQQLGLLILCFSLVSGNYAALAATYSHDIPEGYTPIYTTADLQEIGKNLSENYILMEDITFTDSDYALKFGTLTGVLDGNGHTITGLKLNTNYNPTRIGLFEVNEGTIKNLTLCDLSYVNNSSAADAIFAGSFTAVNYGTIANCVLKNKKMMRLGIYSDTVGGIAGSNSGSIINCQNNTQLTSYATELQCQTVGGIAGNNSGIISECSNSAALYAQAHSANFSPLALVGGIAGNSSGNIQKSYNTGNISANVPHTDPNYMGEICGGIVGQQTVIGNDNHIYIKNCYNTGKISSSVDLAGGIAGAFSKAEISYCYTTESLLIGYDYGDHTNSYNYSNLTTEELATAETFQGFDFENIWEMDNSLMRPSLKIDFAREWPMCIAPIGMTATYNQTLSSLALINPETNTTGTWAWMNSAQSVGDVSEIPKLFKAKFIPSDIKTYASVENISVYLTISKANALSIENQNIIQKNTVTAEQSMSISGLMPSDAGVITYTKGVETTTGTVSVNSWSVDSKGLVKFSLANGVAGNTVELPIIIDSTNYNDSTVNVRITLTDKDIPTVSANDINITYSGKAINDEKITGIATFNGNLLPGIWKFKYGQELTSVAHSGIKTIVFVPSDSVNYAEVETTINLQISKATSTGTPSYTPITISGKTLADAKLTVGTLAPVGTIKWISTNNIELDINTIVTVNTAYKWIFTPDDIDNYTIKSGETVLYVASTGGDGGGSGGSNNFVDTNDKSTVVNPDGSTTTIVTDKDSGSIIETTEYIDGTILTIITEKDGKQKISATVPVGADTATIIIPAKNVTYGSIAKNAKTGEIIKLCIPTKDGLMIVLDKSSDLLLVNNQKDFSDAVGHWAKDAIYFVTSRELFYGTADTIFAPDDSMTRAMLMTVLARFDGQDTTSNDSTWYEKGMLWAKENGISDGNSPDSNITREQLTTMLYRYAGSPDIVCDISSFSDADKIADYADAAMQWAVKTSLIAGIDDGTLNPQGNASRAQLATILMRFCENLIKQEQETY